MEPANYDSYSCGVYWRTRLESLASCVDRATRWYTALGELDPVFTTWYQTGRSRREALSRPVKISPESIERILRNDEPEFQGSREESFSHGFRIWLWNGQDGDVSLAAHARCGEGSGMPNYALVGLPTVKRAEALSMSAQKLLSVDFLVKLLKVLIEIWDPEYGGVYPYEVSEQTGLERGAGPNAGWLTYLAPKIETITNLPPGVRVETLKNGGQLIVATEERCTAANQQHVDLVRALTIELRAVCARAQVGQPILRR